MSNIWQFRSEILLKEYFRYNLVPILSKFAKNCSVSSDLSLTKSETQHLAILFLSDSLILNRKLSRFQYRDAKVFLYITLLLKHKLFIREKKCLKLSSSSLGGRFRNCVRIWPLLSYPAQNKYNKLNFPTTLSKIFLFSFSISKTTNWRGRNRRDKAY